VPAPASVLPSRDRRTRTADPPAPSRVRYPNCAISRSESLAGRGSCCRRTLMSGDSVCSVPGPSVAITTWSPTRFCRIGFASAC
jgi:hypothetical protein